MTDQKLRRFLGGYGMSGVLLLLCIYYSYATLQRQSLTGRRGAEACARQVLDSSPAPRDVLIVAGAGQGDAEFSTDLLRRLREKGIDATICGGEPPLARRALVTMTARGHSPSVIAATRECAVWLPNVLRGVPAAASARVVTPGTVLWPTFLGAENLLNVVNQIVVIAIIAVGMTMVIVTGGIDLSVGSLVALSAVVACLLIRDRAGGASAGGAGLLACGAAAVVAAGLVGAFSGAIVAFFRVPSFIATLAMMQVASGLAFILAGGQSIYDVPQSFAWLGRGSSGGVPNAVILLVLVYVVAWVLMSRTRLGRYIYAVGGNAEAARLSGVGVRRVLVLVYTFSGLSAGLGGVVLASQLKGGSPAYGQSYELYVIAAVVVGGTSLAGGSGKIVGTLIGALIIGVIQNGMNLTGVESYRQKVVLGFVILGAVLLDMLKTRTFRWPWAMTWKRPRVEPPATPQNSVPQVQDAAG